MLIVQLCDFGNDGDFEHRLHEPSRQLAKLAGVTVVDCHVAHQSAPELARRADVLILQFFNDWEILALCESRRAAGKVTVFEANDYFFDIQPWNPIPASWRDRTVQELYLKLLCSGDGVQTSCDWLAERLRQRGARNIAVFQNHLAAIEPLGQASARPLTIGWAGSPGHFADWFAVVPRLSRWLESNPHAHLAVMTNELAHNFFKLPPERYHFTPFGSHIDYMRFLSRLDIGIAPLLPTDYNRGRSDVKFVEYASKGVAGIYQDLEPYRGSVTQRETGLLYRTPDELLACIDELASNQSFRQNVRQRAYDYVAANRMIGSRIGERLAWYRSLLNAARSEPATKVDSSAAPHSSGGHQELRPGESENALLRAMAIPKAQDASPILGQLLNSQPSYLAAIQLQARFFNDLRRHQDAMRCIESARQISPDSARAWSELGRTYFLLNDFSRARAAMIEALSLHPDYLPGWQYLLRLLLLTKSPDAAAWSDRAIERFPTCYPVALLAIEAYPSARMAEALHGVLLRMKSTFIPGEDVAALPAFRKAILAVVAALAPHTLHHELLVPLLETACEVFPQSSRFSGELAAALSRVGREDEAHAHRARAAALRVQAAVAREEFGNEEPLPWEWIFSAHIHRSEQPKTSEKGDSV